MRRINPELQRRYRQLFQFYDANQDGSISLKSDFEEVARTLTSRWQDGPTPFPEMFTLLMATYAHETERRDQDHNGRIDEQEFVDSHEPVLRAFEQTRDQAETFISRAAGGLFDCLDLNQDGILELEDLEAYAIAYGKSIAGIQANLKRMLEAFGLPPDRLPRTVFLTLVTQYWFDPSPDVPGRWLFSFDTTEEIS
jgi:Ca2+-binding EF-hand superfamily protein